MKISVLIPTKDEPLIEKLVCEIHRVLKNTKHEIIIIDKSHVTPRIKNAKVIIQKSNGLGKAVLEGLPYANGDVIITMDGDFSHDPKDLPKFIEKIEEYDIVIGSKLVKGAVTEDELHRKFISGVFRKVASFILNLHTNDPMSGFAAIKRNVYESLNLNPLGYKINMEILYKGRKQGFKSTEVPIIFHKRIAGKSKAGIVEGFRTLIFILKLKLGI